MEELDKKLDEIILKPATWQYDDYQRAKQQIKQAFKDAGWFESGEYYSVGHGPITISGPLKPVSPEEFMKPRLTGQEWYDKFMDEVLAIPLEDYSGSYIEVGQKIREAAKKAAGLDQ